MIDLQKQEDVLIRSPRRPLGCGLVLHNVHYCWARQVRLMESKKALIKCGNLPALDRQGNPQ